MTDLLCHCVDDGHIGVLCTVAVLVNVPLIHIDVPQALAWVLQQLQSALSWPSSRCKGQQAPQATHLYEDSVIPSSGRVHRVSNRTIVGEWGATLVFSDVGNNLHSEGVDDMNDLQVLWLLSWWSPHTIIHNAGQACTRSSHLVCKDVEFARCLSIKLFVAFWNSLSYVCIQANQGYQGTCQRSVHCC